MGWCQLKFCVMREINFNGASQTRVTFSYHPAAGAEPHGIGLHADAPRVTANGQTSFKFTLETMTVQFI
jgi:hypothetical protein